MDTARECQSCEYRWWAKRVAWSPKPSAILHTARVNTGLDYQRRQYDAYKTCPNCGASKVRTVSKAGFVPTGGIAPVATGGWEQGPEPHQIILDEGQATEKIIVPRKMGRMQRRAYNAGRRSAR